ncbi:hypothetical protein ACIQXQ_20700 [Peribacillus sp. NPDC097198]|uniref:AbiTii domain-containing protein n=1 Tax=Peribacillus sp. NPDC097198 TaxID=3364397 RepID=UPI0038064F73
MLKDVVNGKESIESIFLRLKVILTDLHNEAIMEWVNGELKGYNDSKVPEYRRLTGRLAGDYIVNHHAKYTDAVVPLIGLLPSEEIDRFRLLEVDMSIGAIQNLLNGENRENLSKIIPTEICHAISTDEIQILGMNARFASTQLDEIVSNVKAKLVEIVMELEKQFENLDDLDIKDQVENSASKKEKVTVNIEQIIYGDSIEVGDKNKINKSRLGLFGGGRQ